MLEQKEDILRIDNFFLPGITEAEGKQVQPIHKKFIESYIAHKDQLSVEEWLAMELHINLPEKTSKDIEQISADIISTIKVSEEKKQSLEQAVGNGRSKEAWFASETKKATSHMSAQEASNYLQSLDHALASSNESLYQTIHTQSGVINLNPQLDGFIAEQYHAQTFNLNAEATGSEFRAKVLQPEGKVHSKNSVDVVILDGNGKVVKRYQSKYCKDAERTAEAFKKGDYRGQRKLVPDGQEVEIKNSTNVIEAPDGTKSKPLSKKASKNLQQEAQSGQWNDLNWNEYQAKDLAMGIGKQAGQAAVLGAAVGAGFSVAQKMWDGEEIKGEEVIETALVSGVDFGVKAATAGALKVGAEKGLIAAIPKGTPAGMIANIAHVAIENVKVLGKVATGELTIKEGLDKMEQVTVSTVAGIATSAEGAAIGAAIGTVFGPVGTVVGGIVGGAVGYMAGSKVGELVVQGKQKVREVVVEKLASVGNTILTAGSAVVSGVKNLVSSIFG